jgi:hypothetical protein
MIESLFDETGDVAYGLFKAIRLPTNKSGEIICSRRSLRVIREKRKLSLSLYFFVVVISTDFGSLLSHVYLSRKETHQPTS